jgi:hypothetical protein
MSLVNKNIRLLFRRTVVREPCKQKKIRLLFRRTVVHEPCKQKYKLAIHENGSS